MILKLWRRRIHEALRCSLPACLALVMLTACAEAGDGKTAADDAHSANSPQKATSMTEKVVKTKAEWREQLSDLAYKVTREKGTERAFTGKYWNNKAAGIYACTCCGLPLFDSDTKFKSGTGWPSFYQPIDKANVTEHADHSFGMVRTEVTCRRCDAHLGHVFPDGPKPTGLRYCINSVSLEFVPADEEKETEPTEE